MMVFLYLNIVTPPKQSSIGKRRSIDQIDAGARLLFGDFSSDGVNTIRTSRTRKQQQNFLGELVSGFEQLNHRMHQRKTTANSKGHAAADDMLAIFN
jgi:hypothetical protein